MQRIFFYQVVFIGFLSAAVMFDMISRERLGQVLVGLGVIDLVLGLLARAGLPVLRGDAADQAPLRESEMGAPVRDFALGAFLLGGLTLAGGILVLSLG